MIRNAREDDFMHCVAVSRAAWPTFRERESIYHVFCRFFASTCFISEGEDGLVNGFLLGFHSQTDPRDAYIHLVVVATAAQRRGVARALYEAFFEKASQMGATQVRLIVNPENAVSHAFHCQLGFRPDIRELALTLDPVQAEANYNGPGLHMTPYLRLL